MLAQVSSLQSKKRGCGKIGQHLFPRTRCRGLHTANRKQNERFQTSRSLKNRCVSARLKIISSIIRPMRTDVVVSCQKEEGGPRVSEPRHHSLQPPPVPPPKGLSSTAGPGLSRVSASETSLLASHLFYVPSSYPVSPKHPWNCSRVQ